MLLDLHTHKLNADAIVAITPRDNIFSGYSYSAGIHPWNTDADSQIVENELAALDAMARNASIVAIGEAGLDKMRGAPLDEQREIFMRQIRLSEELEKPLIIHCVKAFDELLAIHREMRPTRAWVLHGFRGKPQTAQMLVNKDIMVSFGEKFNAESLKAVPAEMRFAETDMSDLTIKEIIALHAAAAGVPVEELTAQYAQNINRLVEKL